MKKEEALALGVPEKHLREFQDKYNRDVQRAVQHSANGSVKFIRDAIRSMLPMICDEEALREILCLAAEIYSDSATRRRRPNENHIFLLTRGRTGGRRRCGGASAAPSSNEGAKKQRASTF